ncbi:hypothetical protein QQF64_014018 [Cirrhinus molitorella]|uniref:Uncharacterized protein n=2 Tax=Cirrhinus molitorella TaxID=172907 RepID=A0AA88PL00_9TELE|nr:hypothetical protein Q8A67_015264 [Cirrhinus molitorella]
MYTVYNSTEARCVPPYSASLVFSTIRSICTTGRFRRREQQTGAHTSRLNEQENLETKKDESLERITIF